VLVGVVVEGGMGEGWKAYSEVAVRSECGVLHKPFGGFGGAGGYGLDAFGGEHLLAASVVVLAAEVGVVGEALEYIGAGAGKLVRWQVGVEREVGDYL
jgi:hypothetical protein